VQAAYLGPNPRPASFGRTDFIKPAFACETKSGTDPDFPPPDSVGV